MPRTLKTAVYIPCLLLAFIATIEGQGRNDSTLCAFLTPGTCKTTCADDREFLYSLSIPICDTDGNLLQSCVPVGREEDIRSLCSLLTDGSCNQTCDKEYRHKPVRRDAGADPQQGERERRIVGGSVAPSGAWPWVVALVSFNGLRQCGATLIHQRWAVSAAHCFQRRNSPGLWRLREQEYSQVTDFDLPVSRIFIYPDYVPSQPAGPEGLNVTQTARHDVALIQLGEDARAQHICLPNSNCHATPAAALNRLETDGECWVAGWGLTEDSQPGDPQSWELRDTRGSLTDSGQCGRLWQTQFPTDIVCFGSGSRGPCNGYSGGPASCRLDGRWYLGGVVSFGTRNCSDTDHPDILTRLSAQCVLTWITHTITTH
ncbi:hypothetical protein ACOMHN_050071 [Nucella lapillus]